MAVAMALTVDTATCFRASSTLCLCQAAAAWLGGGHSLFLWRAVALAGAAPLGAGCTLQLYGAMAVAVATAAPTGAGNKLRLRRTNAVAVTTAACLGDGHRLLLCRAVSVTATAAACLGAGRKLRLWSTVAVAATARIGSHHSPRLAAAACGSISGSTSAQRQRLHQCMLLFPYNAIARLRQLPAWRPSTPFTDIMTLSIFAEL